MGGEPVGLSRSARVITLIRVAIAGCAVAVSVWAKCPWPGTAGLGFLGAIAIAAEVASLRRSPPRWYLGLVGACALSVLVPAAPLLTAGDTFTVDDYERYYQAVLAWLVAVSVVPVGIRAGAPAWLRLSVITGALIGDTLWLAGAWAHNLRGVFYLGLLVMLALLILCRLLFHLPGPAVVGVNTLLLLILVLGAVDLFVPRPPRLDPHLATARKYYSYEIARKDPLAFARWWDYFLAQWLVMAKAIIVPDHGHVPSFYLRPGARSRLFDCPISINSLGFRGREISRNKGNAYRIVALGESTTFGYTLGPDDKPWPELLEQMIREHLKPRRPVEVINAGVPAYTLEDNLHRLARDVLPLKPDMIISYHGYNGFHLLDESLPVVHGPAPPVYRPRPLTLVANFEYRLQVLRYQRRQTAQPAPHAQPVSDVMNTKYARAYCELVQVAETNRVRLVLANFSMAVNRQSDPDVIEFYRTAFPFVKWQIEANRLHSTLVQEIGREHPEVCLVDTHPHLDGEHEKFIDLVHFTQAGRQQLAETFFAGIKTMLEEDLTRSDDSVPAP